ncbi:sensor histidine kinase [Natranaerobius trueperi]|nr:HAMP domain-containing sensor histidine kinase [Natranaerobius trueperi]
MNRLFSRLLLGFAGVSLGIILFFGILTSYSLNYQFSEYLKDVRHDEHQGVITLLRDYYLENNTFEGISAPLNNVAHSSEMEFLLYIDNDLINSTLEDGHRGPNRRNNGGHRRQQQDQNEINLEEMTTYTYPIEVDNNTVGELEIVHQYQVTGLFRPFEHAFKESVFNNMIISGIITLLLALLISFLISVSISKPIKKLTNSVYNMGTGDFSKRAELVGPQEIKDLAHQFNKMVSNLEEMDFLKTKFTADISHELRNPLASLKSYVEAFQDEILPPSKENLQAVSYEINRLQKLIDDLHELALLESKEQEITMEYVNLNDILKKLKSSVLPKAKNQNINFITSGPNIEVWSNPDILLHILENLVINALANTPSNGEVIVSWYKNKDNIEVIVKDTGSGIEKEKLFYIFERFYRKEPDRSRTSTNYTSGSGLGLSLVKEWVKKINGAISVESESGIGTIFTISLKS